MNQKDFASSVTFGKQLGRKLADRRCRARDWFLKTLGYAAAYGAKHVTAFPGAFFAVEKPADSWWRSCEELAWRVEQAKQHRIVFSVEAHVGSLVPNPKTALRLVRSVPGLTLTLDFTHFTRVGLPEVENLSEAIQLRDFLRTEGAAMNPSTPKTELLHQPNSGKWADQA